MKLRSMKIFVLFLLLGSPIVNTAQNVNIQLEILQDLAQLDLTAFINFGKGNFDALSIPVILQINMDYPSADQVVLSGKVSWKSPDGKYQGELLSFSSHPFSNIKRVNNQEFNKVIKFLSPKINSRLMDENTKRGKPSGTYTIFLTLSDLANGESANSQETIEIKNPSQTFYIQSPMAGSQNDIAGVQAIWDVVEGAKEYKVLANIRKNKNQSFEEALNSGNPIINNKSVGQLTNVNLLSLLDRQWLPGQEIVFRVAAIIPTASGESELNSTNIINFYIISPNSDEDKNLLKNFDNLFNEIVGDLNSNQNLEDENLNQNLILAKRLLEMIESGQLDFNNAQITDENGNVFSVNELNLILDYLRRNPNALLNINYQSN